MSRKQVLFLDDDHRRIDQIRLRMTDQPCDMTVVETADDCIAQLKAHTFDLVMLDHDLGGETFCDSSREDCGMEVVRWLKANGGDHGAFIVHTMNAVAAAGMYLELNAMGYNVRQAQFGSSLFYTYLYKMISDAPPPPPEKPPMSERLSQYFRSLRMKGGR